MKSRFLSLVLIFSVFIVNFSSAEVSRISESDWNMTADKSWFDQKCDEDKFVEVYSGMANLYTDYFINPASNP